ncbi:FAD dependent oxidoreductase [Cylindrobasidium torrendii FP15055 ss-10]|uniref:FAD dependent oxidoreductase n=1 Tax=Cylindrobasidium torrendii FP15055 ss-10 TaxID=1314674 RepID=A0A0D7B3R8_9AGAR|nr:FAD dependent oxidoreductase [Cylindrobasidium torrendii FP15055 ss-10]
MSSPIAFTDLRLTRVGDELVLDQQAAGTSQTPNGKRVLVVGGGVTGLTCAWTLLDAGYEVTVISEKWANYEDRITSQIAGALWEYPPAVCGKHADLISLHHSKRWAMTSYRSFQVLEDLYAKSDVNPGVKMCTSNFFFDKKLEDMSVAAGHLEKFNESLAHPDIKGVRRDANIINELAINQKAGVVDAYQILAPGIDTDAYMFFLYDVVTAKGGVLETRKISGDLLDQELELLEEYKASAIVNATGVSAFETANDKSVYPLRGALVRVVNDGKRFPKVTQALAVTHDETHATPEDLVFIVPRNDDILILGGLVQPHEWNLDLTINSPEVVRMRARCNNFVPGLENAELDPAVDGFVQGLRPFRGSNVRVERELRERRDGKDSTIVHSYGQGGSGFSLSFGCAGDVLDLVRESEAGIKPTKMAIIMKQKAEATSP